MMNKIRIVLWLVFIFGGLWAGYYLDKLLFHKLFVFSVYHMVSFVLGLIVFQAMRAIARHTGKYLHDHGRKGDLPRFQTNVLVTGGYYARMRHPMHQGLMLVPVAFALLAGSPSFLFIVAPLEIMLMLILIMVWEEKEALKKFGPAYRAYAKRTPRFCLRLACWRMLLKDISSGEMPDGKSEKV